MAKEQLDERIDAANEEYNARKIREDMCWNGCDEGHKKQLDDITIGSKNVQSIIRAEFTSS